MSSSLNMFLGSRFGNYIKHNIILDWWSKELLNYKFDANLHGTSIKHVKNIGISSKNCWKLARNGAHHQTQKSHTTINILAPNTKITKKKTNENKKLQKKKNKGTNRRNAPEVSILRWKRIRKMGRRIRTPIPLESRSKIAQKLTKVKPSKNNYPSSLDLKNLYNMKLENAKMEFRSRRGDR